jgi:hypothetical protein
MTRATVALLGLLGLAGPACNRPAPPPPEHKDAAPADAAVTVELDAGPLGLPELGAYAWRKRAGQPAFRLARGAEQIGDWSAVAAACRQALAVDPGHLEASWLLAVGLAKLGKLDQVLAPLSRAVAGDFAKWGQASLELPGLQPFLATTSGQAWRRRVEQDRARFAAAIERSVIVSAEGELHAVALAPAREPAAPDEQRWLRLTRTPGTVLGALAIPAARKIAYVVRERRKTRRELGIGVIDLARGTVSGAVMLATPGPLIVAYSAKPPAGFWVATGAPHPGWRQLDDHYQLQPVPPRTARPPGPWLDVNARGSPRLHALPPNVTADWDDQSLASAIRIGTSNRVVALPGPGLIDGNTAAWSPDRVHLAFVAQLDDHCAPGAVNTAAFVADATTGSIRELERGARGIALQWLGDRKLAVAGDHGVAVYSLDGLDGTPTPIDGATGLMIPRERPRCAPGEPEDPSPDDAAESTASDEPIDAGVVDAR